MVIYQTNNKMFYFLAGCQGTEEQRSSFTLNYKTFNSLTDWSQRGLTKVCHPTVNGKFLIKICYSIQFYEAPFPTVHFTTSPACLSSCFTPFFPLKSFSKTLFFPQCPNTIVPCRKYSISLIFPPKFILCLLATYIQWWLAFQYALHSLCISIRYVQQCGRCVQR